MAALGYGGPWLWRAVSAQSLEDNANLRIKFVPTFFGCAISSQQFAPVLPIQRPNLYIAAELRNHLDENRYRGF